ncbi:hypothetical protein [Photobacterium minamisatsumaniensis]|uniref:hypothetical protein n=1 Tax=Photobacterium minamisatsumaniensis TaxID=2910233 RepID=UPI003D14B7BC
MSSNLFFRAPSEWVKLVVSTLEKRLNINIDTAYRREAKEPIHTLITYQVGESEPVNHAGNDGRKLHEIELRFLVEVPTAVGDFDLEALDASTRLERELLNERFGCFNDVEDTRLISNLPRKFDPDNGVLLRVVTIKQRIYMGPVGEDWHQIVGNSHYDAGVDETPKVA